MTKIILFFTLAFLTACCVITPLPENPDITPRHEYPELFSLSGEKSVWRKPIFDESAYVAEIVNGNETGVYPEVALLLRNVGIGNKRTHCTGTLVGKGTIITAAHCFYRPHKYSTVSSQQLVVSNTEREKWSVYFQHAGIYRIQKIKIHDDYSFHGVCVKRDKSIKMSPRSGSPRCNNDELYMNWMNADIAVVTLDKPVFGINYARVPEDDKFNETPPKLVGYGISNQRLPYYDSMIKREGSISVIDCSSIVRMLDVNSKLICWNYSANDHAQGNAIRSHSDSCTGDSGGPVFNAWKPIYETINPAQIHWLRGVISAGFTNNNKKVTCIPKAENNTINQYSTAVDTAEYHKWLNDAIAISEKSFSKRPQKEWSIKKLWLIDDGEFTRTNQNLQKFQLKFNKGSTPEKLVISLNGAKGNPVSTRHATFADALKRPWKYRAENLAYLDLNEFDLAVVRNKVIHQSIDHSDPLIIGTIRQNQFLSQEAIELTPSGEPVWHSVDYDSADEESEIFTSFIECNQDQPGQIASCTFTKDQLRLKPENELNESQIAVWSIIVRRVSGEGPFQLVVTVFK